MLPASAQSNEILYFLNLKVDPYYKTSGVYLLNVTTSFKGLGPLI